MRSTMIPAGALLLALGAPGACRPAKADPAQSPPARPQAAAAVWQLASVHRLAEGGFDGILPVREVLRHGDHGLAGADNLNGEMAVVDGQVYQFLASGRVVQPADSMRLPFAAVTFWHGGQDVPVTPGLVYVDSIGTLPPVDSRLPGLDAFYAVRMEGSWDTLVVRTFREQTRPYPPLSTAIAGEVVDTLVNLRGTIVGFRQPDYARPMSLPNYHLHFVSADRSRGGHVLHFKAGDARLMVSERPQFTLHMPPAAPASP